MNKAKNGHSKVKGFGSFGRNMSDCFYFLFFFPTQKCSVLFANTTKLSLIPIRRSPKNLFEVVGL